VLPPVLEPPPIHAADVDAVEAAGHSLKSVSDGIGKHGSASFLPQGIAFFALRQAPGVHAMVQPSAVVLMAARVEVSISSV
jgi:hypothetical protein